MIDEAATLSQATQEQVDDWMTTLDEHRPVCGYCPRCRTRGRCWAFAIAFGFLVAHGQRPR